MAGAGHGIPEWYAPGTQPRPTPPRNCDLGKESAEFARAAPRSYKNIRMREGIVQERHTVGATGWFQHARQQKPQIDECRSQNAEVQNFEILPFDIRKTAVILESTGAYDQALTSFDESAPLHVHGRNSDLESWSFRTDNERPYAEEIGVWLTTSSTFGGRGSTT